MKVYLNELVADSVRAKLAEHYEIVDNFDHPEEIDAIMVRQVPVTREIIDACKNLKVISMHGIGLDRIDIDYAKEKGIPVYNVPGVGAESVAELVIAYFMSLSRNLKKANVGVREGRFKTFGPAELVGHEVTHKTVGVIGFGNISKIVCRVMENAFSTKIVVYDPFVSKEAMEALNYTKIETVEKLFEVSDLVSISVPLTDSTRNMVNAEVLSHAKPGLILVNTARGGIIDEEALYDALVSGKLGGAALDVSVEEPMNKDNKLLKLDNFMNSPHIGGSTYESRERVGLVAVDHIVQVLG